MGYIFMEMAWVDDGGLPEGIPSTTPSAHANFTNIYSTEII